MTAHTVKICREIARVISTVRDPNQRGAQLLALELKPGTKFRAEFGGVVSYGVTWDEACAPFNTPAKFGDGQVKIRIPKVTQL